MMDEMKKIMELQKKAQKIQEKLANTHIEATEGSVTVIINGKQECVEVKIEDTGMDNKKQLQKDMVTGFNKGLKKSQEIAASEMKDVMGDLGLGGMGGMDKMLN